MRDQISTAVGPLNFLEEIWVNDVVNLVWETQRLRRLKAALLQAHAHQGVKKIMTPFLGILAAGDLADQWAAREPEAIKHVEAILNEAGLTMEAVKAETLVLELEEFERIERLIASAEARRNAILREIDRHRSSLAEALRQTAEETIDGEFEEIPPPETEGQAA
jgi:ribosomal protein L12E/L44/L45/RPP1/RPP2